MIPLNIPRRQLHRFQPSSGGIRKRYGGSISLGLKKGGLVRHDRYGLCYVGGNTNGRLSLHSLETGSRICRTARVEDTKFLAYSSFR